MVNEGGDADTNGAIAGAKLGAKFGFYKIPEYYIDDLYNGEACHNKITNFIEQILNEKA